MTPLMPVCETCELRQVCEDDEDLRYVLLRMSYRERAIITNDEFKLALNAKQRMAEQKCQEARYKTEDCDFTTADDLLKR